MSSVVSPNGQAAGLGVAPVAHPDSPAPPTTPGLEALAAALGAKLVKGKLMFSCPLNGHGRGRGDRNPSATLWLDNDQRPAVHCYVCGKDRDKELWEAVVKPRLVVKVKAKPARRMATYYADDGRPPLDAMRIDCAVGQVCTYKGCKSEDSKHNFTRPKGSPTGYRVKLWGVDDGQSSVALCEGEPAANAVAEAGWVAASYCSGSSQAAYANYAPLKGREVLVWPDNDPAGLKAADSAAAALVKAGAASVVILPAVSTPDKPTGADAADLDKEAIRAHIRAGGIPWTEPAPPTGLAVEETDLAFRPLVGRNSLGLGNALELLSLEMRLNLRSNAVEWRNGGGWHDLDDFKEADIRERIAAKVAFNGRAGATPAYFGDKIWRNASLAYLHHRRVDPFQHWLESLPSWDGRERLEQIFIAPLKAADTELNRTTARRWLTAAVARTYQPGVKADWMPVLIGGQGGGKSTLLELLVPALDYYAVAPALDNPPKVICEGIGQAVIVEFAELPGLEFKNIERIKAFLTTRSDRYRASYGRYSGHYMRRWVGAGTANDGGNGILPHDSTGSRRFVIVECGTAEGDQEAVVAWIEQHREMLWAEALRYYRDGDSWDLPYHLLQDRDEVNRRHTRGDMLLEDVLDDMADQETPLRLAEVMERVGRGERDQKKVVAALKSRGWTQERRRFKPGANPVWVWAPPLQADLSAMPDSATVPAVPAVPASHVKTPSVDDSTAAPDRPLAPFSPTDGVFTSTAGTAGTVAEPWPDIDPIDLIGTHCIGGCGRTLTLLDTNVRRDGWCRFYKEAPNAG